MKVSYPEDFTATKASEVTFSDPEPGALGAWQDLALGGTPILSCRVHRAGDGTRANDTLVSMVNTQRAPTEDPSGGTIPGGCCADTLRTWAPSGATTDFDLLTTVQNIFEGVALPDTLVGGDRLFAYANHALDLTSFESRTIVALTVVCYLEPELDGALIDAVVAVDVASGEVLPTKDGRDFFSFWREIGTNSTLVEDGIYKIQFYPTSNYSTETYQQFHMNGLTRFQHKSGTWVLAVSHKTHSEVLLLKCPYTYASSEGGGSILQRFGNPYHWNGSSRAPEGHIFGLAPGNPSIVALHNVYHVAYGSGRETISTFVNSIQPDDGVFSHVYEFDIKLTPEDPENGPVADTVFATDFISTTIPYQVNTWGGARPVGDGVWLVGRQGLIAVDSEKKSTSSGSTVDTYDAFITALP